MSSHKLMTFIFSSDQTCWERVENFQGCRAIFQSIRNGFYEVP